MVPPKMTRVRKIFRTAPEKVIRNLNKFERTGSENECENQFSKYNTSVGHIIYYLPCGDTFKPKKHLDISDGPAFQRSSVPAFRRSSVPAFQRSSVPAFQRSSVPAFLSCWTLKTGLQCSLSNGGGVYVSCCRRHCRCFDSFIKVRESFRIHFFLSRALEYRSPIFMSLNRSTQLEITADQSRLAAT